MDSMLSTIDTFHEIVPRHLLPFLPSSSWLLNSAAILHLNFTLFPFFHRLPLVTLFFIDFFHSGESSILGHHFSISFFSFGFWLSLILPMKIRAYCITIDRLNGHLITWDFLVVAYGEAKFDTWGVFFQLGDVGFEARRLVLIQILLTSKGIISFFFRC